MSKWESKGGIITNLLPQSRLFEPSPPQQLSRKTILEGFSLLVPESCMHQQEQAGSSRGQNQLLHWLTPSQVLLAWQPHDL